MTTTINYNGSRYLGGHPASLEALLELMTLERLCYWTEAPVKDTHWQQSDHFIYSGNFERISHAFSVTTDDPNVIEAMDLALEVNRHIRTDREDPIIDRVSTLMQDGADKSLPEHAWMA